MARKIVALSGGEPQRTFLIERLAPKRSEVILDLGCGAGEDLQRILQAARVKKVVGLDSSEKMLRIARRRLTRYAKRGRVELRIGDAGTQLPFPSRSFDAVLSAEVMECLPEAKRRSLLLEIHRVLKTGGRVVIEHTDWDTQLWNASDRQLERRLVHAFCDWKQDWMEHSDGWMGRKLLGLLRGGKRFKHIEVAAHILINDRYRPGTYGYERSQDLRALAKQVKGVRPTDVRRFLSDLQRRDRRGTYFYSVTRYVVAARAGS